MTLPADPYKRIFWSADVGTTGNLIRALSQMERRPNIKIDRAFFVRRGNGTWDIFEALSFFEDVRIFDDSKFWGTPREIKDLVQNYVDEPFKPWMLNCAAGITSTGKYDIAGDKADSLKQFADTCLALGIKPCGVTVPTTTTREVALNQFQRSVVEQVEWYADEMWKAGFTHIVCSPFETEVLRRREHFRKAFTFVNPSIRPAGSDPGQQARADTPAGAFAKGADYIVVGSPITDGNGTYQENLDAIAAEIQPFV